MSLGTDVSTALQEKVRTFAQAQDRDTQMAVVDGLQEAWASSSGKLTAATQP